MNSGITHPPAAGAAIRRTRHIRPSLHRRTALAAAMVILASFAAQFGMVQPASAAPGDTVVSLTFDDGNADQFAAAQTLANNGLPATYFINSGFIDKENYLTRANLQTMAGLGHEIGGHTSNHTDLPAVSADDAKRAVCNDRAALLSWGFPVTSFAYPFASTSPAVETIVKDCGYNSARALGDLRTPPGTDCAECAFAESIPPTNPYRTRAADQADASWTLEKLQKTVTDAETNGGGWVQLTFHHICNSCALDNGQDLTVSPALLAEFAAWLAAWEDGTTKTVQTVGDVIGGTVKPAVNGPEFVVPPPPGPGVNALQNPGLETIGANGLPQCWSPYGFGQNSPAFAVVNPGRTGNAAVRMTMTNYQNGDARLMPTLIQTTCSSGVTAGHTYSLRAWYTSDAVTQFMVYYRDNQGAWSYATASPLFHASAAFTQAEWTTAPIPAGVTGISFGLNLLSNGTITTDDYAMYDSAGAPPLDGSAQPAVTRVTGADRYEVSARISASTFASAAPVAYVASGRNFPDALSGSAVAGVNRGPVLLVEPTSIPQVIAAELTRLKPARIVVLGGPNSVSEAVLEQLKAFAG